MQDRKQPKADDARSFTSWKLDILNAACADSRLRASEFRMLARILQATNAQTRKAIIADDTLADEVPGFKSQSSAWRARRAIADAGYFTFVEGKGRSSTAYSISDEPVNAILDDLGAKRDARPGKRAERRSQRARGERTLARLKGRARLSPCEFEGSDPARMKDPLHLTSTPSELSLSGQDMAPAEDTRRCCECGKAATVFRSASEIDWYCDRHAWLAVDLGD
ncbi:hypothetical protein [Methylobacterium isbiliense]|uniref:hypothetical protein n=1 Tax=Methylobacterium isbiliense TaxID=315478 RepID=UPI001EDE69B3|nr:hypothetical protein [Methylobacterium isbiliense]MDN3622005.1 hypothetical protein [Methylobacterium isbiliense]